MARWLTAVFLALTLVAPASSFADGERPVRSMLELRRERVVPQGWDLSCGAAALSTLLTYEYGDPVSEPEIVAGLLQHADPTRIRNQGGFTLLDLKRYASARGYSPTGFGNVTLAALARLGPAIVPTLARGQPHFMVFRGLASGRVVLADPAYGTRIMRREQFEALWSPRVAFVVRGGPTRTARRPDETSSAPLVPDAVIRGTARWAP
jgi:uncharacterized protein